MTYKELLDKLLEFDEKTLQEPVTVYVVDDSGHMNAEFSTDVTGFSYETWSYRVNSTTPCLTVNL